MKTPIRWAGSKKALLPILRNYWAASHGRYIEPFCGSACFFFDVEPNRALLGDINSDLIIAYRELRRDPSRVIECLLRLQVSENNYYRIRHLSRSELSEAESAARFLFLNRLCFNGIYRTNLAGDFNVPYAHPKRPVKFNRGEIYKTGMLLRRASLFNADFDEVLQEARKDDFVYLDPPYAVARRRVFSEYHPDSFSEQDILRLKSSLVDLDRRGVAFVVSYADSKEGRHLVSDWPSKRIRTRRNVAGFVGHRRAAYELMASNKDLV